MARTGHGDRQRASRRLRSTRSVRCSLYARLNPRPFGASMDWQGMAGPNHWTQALMETTAGLTSVLQRILLSRGILARLLHLGTDLLAGRLLNGYGFSCQSMSELGAAGSPTRPLVVALCVVAIAVGAWRAADRRYCRVSSLA